MPSPLGKVARRSRDGRGVTAVRFRRKAKDLSARFIKNFEKYTGNDEGKALVAAGPQL